MGDMPISYTPDSAAGGAAAPATPATDASNRPAQPALTPATALAPASGSSLPATPAQASTMTPQEHALKQESWGTKLYHGVLNALGGSGDVSYSRDPQTGKLTATPVATGPGTQWKRIIAGALSGFGAAAQAGTQGPGGALRGAGAGVAAGMGMARQRDQEARGEADKDFEAQLKLNRENAQNALLTHQVTKGVFELGREKVQAAQEDSDRESNFEKVIADGGQGSTDLGNFADFNAVMQAFKDVPALHDHQAGGRIIAIPHINSKGEVDGVHAALVTPDWLNSKINRDLPITQRTFKDGKVTESTFTIPAGSLTGQQYSQMVMAQSKDAVDDWTKTVQTNTAAQEAQDKAGLYKAEEAKDYADAAESRSKVLLNEATAAGKNDNVEWGPGGEKGFERWHDKNVTPALQAEKTYRLASNVYNEYEQLRKQGKNFPTGAQSVQMLSYHMANTFGNVKGARITKDLIQKHLGARSVSDTLETAVNKLVNGEALSDKQWDAFFSMVGQNRDETWRSVMDDADALGRPNEYIAYPQDLRDRWGLGPGHIPQHSINQAVMGTAPGTAPQSGGTPAAAPGAQPGGAMITVQIPGQPPGQIPASALQKFQQDHPNATVKK